MSATSGMTFNSSKNGLNQNEDGVYWGYKLPMQTLLHLQCSLLQTLGVVHMFNAVKLGSAVSQELMDYKLILLHEIFLQFDWLRAVVFQLNLKNLHVKITNLLRVVV